MFKNSVVTSQDKETNTIEQRTQKWPNYIKEHINRGTAKNQWGTNGLFNSYC